MTQFFTAVRYTGAVFVLILLSSCGGQQIRNYGETCSADVECVDRHMLCQSTETESNVTRCYCDRFYSWHEELKECMQADNISLGFPTLNEQQDVTKKNSRSEHKMFIKISIVGLIAVISISVFLLSCIAYGCCSCTRVGNTKTNEPATSCPPTCPLHQVPLLQQDKLHPDQEKKQWRDMHCPIPTVLDDVDIC